MKDLFEKQPISSEAPQGLRNKVEFAARQKPKKQWFGPRMRWAAAGTAVAAAAIGTMVFMTPASAEAKTWDMVTAAYQQVKGVLVQMEFTGENEGGSILVAGKGQDWRVQFEGRDNGKTEKMDISYSRGELTMWDGGGTAQVINLGINIPFSPEDVMQGITEQLTASKIFKEHADEIGRENIRIEQPVRVNGQRVYNVYINDKDGQGRVHVLVDADSDLPISMEVSGDRGEQIRMKFQFNGDFDSGLLQPVLPSGIKFNYVDPKSLGGHDKDLMQGMEEFGKAFSDGDLFSPHKDEVKVDVKTKVERA